MKDLRHIDAINHAVIGNRAASEFHDRWHQIDAASHQVTGCAGGDFAGRLDDEGHPQTTVVGTGLGAAKWLTVACVFSLNPPWPVVAGEDHMVNFMPSLAIWSIRGVLIFGEP